MPRRRCVGCGRTAPKIELVRIALVRGENPRGAVAVADSECRMPGRGAYLCRGRAPEVPAAECLEQAARRGGVARALRAAVTLDPKLVESVSR
ncbi:MAG TPA: YlxR family protein [Solirubrobacteraceae bacterium]